MDDASTLPATIAYTLPRALRTKIREPFAKVVDEATLVSGIQDGTYGKPLVAVGDMVADTLLRHHLDPRLIVYDLITKRDAVGATVRTQLENHPARLVEVASPAGSLSAELVAAIKAALARKTPTKIHVHGEEDLATLPALAYCPLGGTVIYGMPNRGLVPVPATRATRRVADDWMSLMKVDPNRR